MSDLLAWLDEHEPPSGRDQFFRAYRAWSLAKVGRFDEARAILAVARAEQTERGGGLLLANLTSFESASVEMLAGDLVAADAFCEVGIRLQQENGDTNHLAAAAAIYAQVSYALGRIDEADRWASFSAEHGSRDDIWKESLWRPVRAMVLARRGDHAAADRVAREAVALLAGTDVIEAQAGAGAALGEVLVLAGRPEEAVEVLEDSIARYDRKGNIVMAGRTRERLAAIRAT